MVLVETLPTESRYLSKNLIKNTLWRITLNTAAKPATTPASKPHPVIQAAATGQAQRAVDHYLVASDLSWRAVGQYCGRLFDYNP